jgi:outer membrane protein TolC
VKLRLISYFLQERDKNLQLIEEKRSAYFGNVLPKLDLIHSQSYNKTLHYNSSDVTISQQIPYPQKWQKEYEILKTDKLATSLENEFEKDRMIRQARKDYFLVKLSELKLSNAEKNLKLLQQIKDESESRYKKGFLHIADRERSKLQLDLYESRYLDLQLTYQNQKNTLATLSCLPDNAFNLSTTMNLQEQWLTASMEDLKKILVQYNNKQLQSLKTRMDAAQLQVDKSRYAFLPNLSLSAQLPLKDNLYPTPVYTASLTWNLFNGGLDVSNVRQEMILKERWADQLNFSEESLSNDLDTLFAKIVVDRNRLLKQRKAVQSWEAIVALTQKRFLAGEVSSKDMSDDLRSYLEQNDILYQITFDLLDSLADVSFKGGKQYVFYQFLTEDSAGS